MRFIVAVFVLLAIACRKPKPDAAVERYVNVDMPEAIARVQEAAPVFERLSADDFGKPATLKNMIRAATALREARVKASAVTPPPAMAQSHGELLSMTSEIKSVLDKLIAAEGLGVKAKFDTAHAELMQTAQAYYSWQERFGKAVSAAHVVMGPLPALPPLPEAAPPPTPAPEVTKPPPPACVKGTEVMKEGALVECDLEKGTDSIPACAPGHATFDPRSGEITGCITQSMWPLPYESARPKEQVVVCGPGAYTRDAAGNTTSCTLGSTVTIGATTLAKGTFVTIDATLNITSANVDGKKLCFDAAGSAAACAP